MDGTAWRKFGPPIGLAAATLSVFVVSLAPTVTSEDSGELIAAAWHFGVAHPPGYPLWTILCGAFTHLFAIGTVAWRANLFSALCGSAAGVVTYGGLRQLDVTKPAAAAASATWVFSHWFWSQSVITEVYALNSLITAGILWCGFRWYRTSSPRPLLVASLLLGLGMSNHHTIALAGLPAVIWILVQRPSLVRAWHLIMKCVALFLVGLLPYLYLPIRAHADPPVNWGDPSSAQRFWEHVTRHQYGAVGPMKVTEPRSLERLGPQLGYLIESVCDDLTIYLAAFAALGMAYMAWRHRRLLLFVLLWLICTGLLFVILANYDLDRTSRWAMRVFLIPVSLGLVIPIAFLLGQLTILLRNMTRSTPRVTGILVAAIVFVGPFLQVITHWPRCNYSHYWYARDHAQNMLNCMMDRALVFPSGDHNTFPLVYVTTVEGHRPDVLIADIYGYVRPELYRDRPVGSSESPGTWLIKHARRPVYYTTKKRRPVEGAQFVPAGILYHLLPKGKVFSDADLLNRCKYRNLTEPTVIDFGASHIIGDYEFFAGLHDLANGDVAGALAHFRRTAESGQDIKEVFNNIGSALAEHGAGHEATAYFEQAAALDWRYVLPRRNLFHLMKENGHWHEATKWLQEIIQADPEDHWAYGEMGFLLSMHFDDQQKAIQYWRESLRRNPAQPQIVRALAESY